ncbi:MAG: hypothetical protein JNK95_14190 [Candidatus Competibacter sp.]|nr:hypothetical protein [Candidatus Competibacter sp.]MDG4604975.1 hypothetical protein [Candidatus Contendobacter sp.]HRD49825.1 hypothetical protein [Candidatus Contendobacter sp.]
MQIPLGNSSLEGVREVGGFGQPLHTLYPQIRAVLASELGPEAACILAEPVVDRTGNRIDWYTEGDPDEKPVRLHALSEDQRRPILDRIEDFLGRGRELAERYAASADPRRVQLGAILQAVLHPPAETDIFLISGQPVMIGWGFALDRPWELTASPVRRPATPMAESAAAPRDVALPDIAMPELTSAAPLEPVPASASQPVIEQREKAPPPLPTLEPVPLKPAPVLPAQPLPPQPEPVPPSEPTPAAVTVSPLPRSEPEPNSAPVSSLRYVVVGSRYFWGVFAFAVLLAVVAAFWLAMGRPSPQSTVGAMLAPLSDTEPDPALTEAQRTERELRTRLESLLVQLAERRGQCSPPARSSSSDAAAASPAIRGSERTAVIPSAPAKPAAGSNHGERSTVAPPQAGVDAGGRIKPPPGMESLEAAPAKAGREIPPALSTRSADSEPESSPPPALAPPPVGVNPVVTATPPPTAPTSRPPTAGESLDRSLEEALAAPPKRPPPTAPPVKADPTPEERREFASRMSATGAATGEITATLLWNSAGDLDLVVRCPSGQQLDYRNSSGCGGTLDVDANAVRTGLSERPVENAFWPAGKAAPGNYEIAVRYAPRKDEQNPGETPFQVRLSRGGQESVFKGAIRPNTLTPVTTFTVER